MDLTTILLVVLLLITTIVIQNPHHSQIIGIICYCAITICSSSIAIQLISGIFVFFNQMTKGRDELLLFLMLFIGLNSILSNNIFQIFLALELINFVSITLIPLHTCKILSLESSLKYFIASVVSAAMFVLA